MDDLTKELIAAGEKIAEEWKEKLADGKISVSEIYGLVSTLVIVADGLTDAAKAGEIKHKAVKEAFSYFDRKYEIIKRLDDLIKLPWWIEPFDGRLMRSAVDILIGQAVGMMNRMREKFSEDETPLLDEHHAGEEAGGDDPPINEPPVKKKRARRSSTKKPNITMDDE